MNCCITFVGDLFIEVNVWVEAVTLLGWFHNKRIVHQSPTDSPEQYTCGFFLLPRPVAPLNLKR